MTPNDDDVERALDEAEAAGLLSVEAFVAAARPEPEPEEDVADC